MVKASSATAACDKATALPVGEEERKLFDMVSGCC